MIFNCNSCGATVRNLICTTCGSNSTKRLRESGKLYEMAITWQLNMTAVSFRPNKKKKGEKDKATHYVFSKLRNDRESLMEFLYYERPSIASALPEHAVRAVIGRLFFTQDDVDHLTLPNVLSLAMATKKRATIVTDKGKTLRVDVEPLVDIFDDFVPLSSDVMTTFIHVETADTKKKKVQRVIAVPQMLEGLLKTSSRDIASVRKQLSNRKKLYKANLGTADSKLDVVTKVQSEAATGVRLDMFANLEPSAFEGHIGSISDGMERL